MIDSHYSQIFVRVVMVASLLGACADVTPKGNGRSTGEGEQANTTQGSGFDRRATGLACTADSECNSDVCADHGGEQLCTARCADGIPCAEGLSCTKRNARDAASPFICVPEGMQPVCRACLSDGDCTAAGAACVQSTDGKVCGLDCSISGQAGCPRNYDCVSMKDSEGTETSKQCIPRSGACPSLAAQNPTQCTGPDCDPSTTTPGTPGTSGSTGTVTPPCVPSEEVCDGEDNDCDGLFDEDEAGAPLSETCGTGVGICVGKRTCGFGGIWSVCDAPFPEAETCDGRDNDCDGNVDNGLLDKVDSCGTCGNVCPGAGQDANSSRTCTRAGDTYVCGITCKGNKYDNNSYPNDGCEWSDDEDTRQNGSAGAVGSYTPGCQVMDSGNASCPYWGKFPADNRPHDPAPVTRSGPTSLSTDWYIVSAVDTSGPDLQLYAVLDTSRLPSSSIYEVCLGRAKNSTAVGPGCGARPAGNPTGWCNASANGCCCAVGGSSITTSLNDVDYDGWTSNDSGNYYMRVRWISGTFVPVRSGDYYSVTVHDDRD